MLAALVAGREGVRLTLGLSVAAVVVTGRAGGRGVMLTEPPPADTLTDTSDGRRSAGGGGLAATAGAGEVLAWGAVGAGLAGGDGLVGGEGFTGVTETGSADLADGLVGTTADSITTLLAESFVPADLTGLPLSPPLALLSGPPVGVMVIAELASTARTASAPASLSSAPTADRDTFPVSAALPAAADATADAAGD